MLTGPSYPTTDDVMANATDDNGWFTMHSIGVTAALEGTSLTEAFRQTLGWNVEKDAAINGTTLDVVPGLALMRRTDTNNVLGWAKQSYQPIQNADVLDMLAQGLADVDYSVAASGSLRGGARTIVAIRLHDAGGFNVDGDTIQPYLIVGNSFDGSSTLRLLNVAIRPACTNMLNMMLGQKSAVLTTVRHTRNAPDAMRQMSHAVRRFTIVRDEFQTEMERMIATTVTGEQAHKVLDALAPVPVDGDASKAAVTRAIGRREALETIYFGDDPRVGYRGTEWGLFQTASTFGQNDGGFRRTAGGPATRDDRKIEKALDGGKAEDRAFSTIRRVLAAA